MRRHGDEAARPPLGEPLAGRLGMRPFRSPTRSKPLYHLAATVACNLLVALESEAQADGRGRQRRQDGLELLAPLLRTTLKNLLRLGPAHALTGPVARGDVGTVALTCACSTRSRRAWPQPTARSRSRRSRWPRRDSTTRRCALLRRRGAGEERP